MNRRSFLKSGLVSVGGLAAGGTLFAASDARGARSSVAGSADVIVAGGGPAGISAAVSFARRGKRVILLETHGCLGGIWTSDRIGGWKPEQDGIPSMGDCPCPFEWNGWHYIIQGFCTMARSRTGENGTYEDEVLAGYDVYEGLSVPMVAPWKDNRRLLIGWINHCYGWGGWLCFRELVQYPDGHLGTKWVKEMPLPVTPKTYAVRPGETFTLAFNGGKAGDFAFVLDSAKGKARFVKKAADGTYPDIPSLQDIAVANKAKHGAKRIRAGRKYRPDDGNDFAIGNIRGLDKPFEVKVENYFDRKSGFTLLDIEIAGQRTMVTRRRGRFTVDGPGKD